ncbi:MAG: hypothetical protein DIU68_000235 [Chloroflexota bacterium]
MTDRYYALNIISTIYKLAAGLMFVITVLAVIVILITAFQSARYFGSRVDFGLVFVAGGAFLGGSITALGVYAAGEFIALMIEVALNTRNTDMNARTMNQQLQIQLDLMQRQLRVLERAVIRPQENSSPKEMQVN